MQWEVSDGGRGGVPCTGRRVLSGFPVGQGTGTGCGCRPVLFITARWRGGRGNRQGVRDGSFPELGVTYLLSFPFLSERLW